MNETIEQMTANERRLWKEMEELQKPYEDKRDEWHKAYLLLNDATEKARIRAEVMAEIQQPKQEA